MVAPQHFNVPAARFHALDGPVSSFYPCPPDLLQRINLRYLYHQDGRLCKVFCPNHDDAHEPNLVIYPGNAYCFACSFYETAFQHIERVCGTRSYAETVKIATSLLEEHQTSPHTVVASPINPSLVSRYREELDGSTDLQAYLLRRYGLGVRVQRSALLGYSSAARAFTIPVFDLDGSLANIRFRSNIPDSQMKYWGIEGHNFPRWYYTPSILAASGTLSQRVRQVWAQNKKAGKRSIIVSEGEFDALAFDVMGLPAISSVAGARSLLSKSEQVEGMLGALKGLNVLVAYDQDKAGREASNALVEVLRGRGIHSQALDWPVSYGKDASELLSVGVNIATFRAMCDIRKVAPKNVRNMVDKVDTA